MITATIINFFLILIANIIAILPLGSLPAGVHSAFQWMVDTLYKFSGIMPVATILTILGYAISFHVAVFGFKTGIWIYNKFRGATGSR